MLQDWFILFFLKLENFCLQGMHIWLIFQSHVVNLKGSSELKLEIDYSL